MGTGRKLKITTPSDREIAMEREFDAPRELVFEAHTSCEHMAHWWGPHGYEFAACEVDFRPGGKWRIVHRAPDGGEFPFRGEYREIVRPERIVWMFGFEGMVGEPAVETLTLEERDGVTILRTLSVYDSRESRDAMLQSGMEWGANQSMERLDDYLETLAARAT